MMNGEQDSTPRITEAMLEFTTIAGLFALIFALFFLLSAFQDASM
jgi:hypothetical protein